MLSNQDLNIWCAKLCGYDPNLPDDWLELIEDGSMKFPEGFNEEDAIFVVADGFPLAWNPVNDANQTREVVRAVKHQGQFARILMDSMTSRDSRCSKENLLKEPVDIGELLYIVIGTLMLDPKTICEAAYQSDAKN